MNNLGRNLYYLRVQNRLLQSHMQHRLGISRTTWSNYENGLSEPSIGNLVKISNFFGISLDALILQDLSLRDPSQSLIKSARTAFYKKDGIPQSGVGEHEDKLSKVLKELRKLKKDINSIKSGSK